MSNIIRQLEERVVATEITLMRWSDRMDLLALANTKETAATVGNLLNAATTAPNVALAHQLMISIFFLFKWEVSLHRITWQKVWTLPPDKDGSTVVDMNWRPDGKIISVAYSSGDVLLVEVENKNILRTINVEDNISCIAWLQDKSFVNKVETNPTDKNNEKTNDVGDSSKYLPDLPSLSNEFPSTTKNPVENLIDVNFVKNQNDLNILIIGTKSGTLQISIFGLFTCALINISTYLKKTCTVLNAHMSENLSSLYVIVCDEEKTVHTIVLDTSIISSYSKELFAIALKHGYLVSLLLYLENTMSSITEAWESILLEMDSKLSKYASNVPEGTVSADFLDLLMFGIPSDEMEEFLMQDLTDKGLKKMGHSIDLSYSNIQKLLLKHLTQVGQNITYHLAELRGMARFAYRYKNLGLNERTITSAIMANGAFLVKGVEVQQVINHSMTNYKAFFRWLYVVILRLMDEQTPPEIPKMAQQDLAYITEFLQNFDSIGNGVNGQKGRFNLERLGQYLLDAPLTILSKNDSNIWNNYLEHHENLANHESTIKHFESMSLVQQHKHLVKNIMHIFTEPNESISASFKFKLNFKSLHITDLQNVSMTQLNYNENTTLVAFSEKKSTSDGIYLLEIFNSNQINCAYIFCSHIPDNQNSSNCKILDVKFYSTTYLSVLLEEVTENRTPYLCQVPILYIKSHLKPISVDSNLCNSDLNKIDICDIPANIVRQVEGMTASRFSVTSSRHVCVVLSDNQRKVQLFEMEAEEEDDELDETYVTANSTHENEAMLQESITSDDS